MILTVILSLLSSSQADFASIHIQSFLNDSVAPCDNFYRHVCSIGMNVNDTAQKKSTKFYDDLATTLKARSLNNPVINDIEEARAEINCTFDASVYEGLLRERCNSDFDCFFDEYKYFLTLFNKTTENVDDSLNFYLTHGNRTGARNMTQSTRATSRMVELLYTNSNTTRDFNNTVNSYLRGNDRLFVMEYLMANGTDYAGLAKIHNQTKQMKEIILRTFRETPWMRTINEFGFDILGQYLAVMDELIILTDFDSFDKNLTTQRQINRETTTRYFENSKRNTGCAWFDVVHAFNTTTLDLDKKYTSYQDQVDWARTYYGLIYNAFNFVEASIIDVIGPTFFPLLENSTETTMIAFAGDILGHEIFHSFITEALLNRSEEYRNERDCMAAHYNASCQLFAEGECNSGVKTFSEDGADVEGIRAAYVLLQQELSREQMNEIEYPEQRITREQSFFYSVAMRSCADISKGIYREHSPDNIRINALVSQMPEFTRAFGCKTDDLLYAEEEQVCYLFGAKATGVWDNSTLTATKKSESTTALNNNDHLDEGARLLDY